MTSADLHRCGGDHAATVHQRELGRGAPDVDVKDTRHIGSRALYCARAPGAKHRLHMVASSGRHKLAGLFRQGVHNCGGVLLAGGSSRHDDDARFNVVWRNSGEDISAVDDGAQLYAMNKGALEGRQRNGR